MRLAYVYVVVKGGAPQSVQAEPGKWCLVVGVLAMPCFASALPWIQG